MKRKNLVIAVLPILLGLFAFQSCTKEDSKTFTVFNSFTEPTVVAPLNGEVVKGSPATINLKWASTDAENDAILCDVYFGTSATPPLFKAGNTALTLSVPVQLGLTYYWSVTMKDNNGVMTKGPISSFTVFEPIGIFVGKFNADEPAEDYSYPVVFTKASPTTLNIDAYWNSWAAVFTLNFTANTFSMAKTNFGGGYEGIESGTIDPATGKMVGTYTIWQTKAGVTKIIEEGVHTYTKL